MSLVVSCSSCWRQDKHIVNLLLTNYVRSQNFGGFPSMLPSWQTLAQGQEGICPENLK